jgi:hypothetical protein
MNETYGSSAYFERESDARRAAEDLQQRGYDVDVRNETSHGQNFWESIKNFFTGQQDNEAYRTGTVLMVDGGDSQIISTVVQQYNGRMGMMPGAVGTNATTGDITGKSDATREVTMMDTNMAAAAGPDTRSPQTTIGETDVGSMEEVTDETDRTRNL